jgi:hypothetical protein
MHILRLREEGYKTINGGLGNAAYKYVQGLIPQIPNDIDCWGSVTLIYIVQISVQITKQ